jgi:hypothetical protein
MNYPQVAEFFVIDQRCSHQEIAERITIGLMSRNLTFKNFLFTREDENFVYVFYYVDKTLANLVKRDISY